MDSSRRSFLATSVTAASAGRVVGANERIRLAVVGTGPRGRYLMKELTRLGGVEWVAVCDVYDVRRAQAAEQAGGKVEQYTDYRPILERKDVDAVIVATPDHWHAPVAIDAMNAGKDVYVEKPMVHNPRDGQALVKAARHNKRIVQVGMQGRGLPQFVEAKQKYIDSGVIGKVGLARTWYTSNRGYIQAVPPGMEKKPEGLDWDRWLGRGPKIPWNPNVYFSPYKWLHYDGGMIMGIAIHVVDSAHHWLSLHQPKSAMTGGGTYFFKDGRDTPDVVTCILDYPQEVTVTFAAECLTCPGIKTTAGVELRGTGGTLWAERYVQNIGYQYTPNDRYSKEPAVTAPRSPAYAMVVLTDWLECLRTRHKTIANEEEGYFSSMACFMANQAYRTQSRVAWESKWDLPAA
ncbi:MAG: Gfo/Idh/MocA family protein [Bryobacteraceae bacterium]